MTHLAAMQATLNSQGCAYDLIDGDSPEWSDWRYIAGHNTHASHGIRIGDCCYMYGADGGYLGRADADNIWVPKQGRKRKAAK